MDLNTIKELAETFGLPAIILCYFVYTDWNRRKEDKKREAGIVKDLRGLEDFQKKQMSAMIKDTTGALEKNTIVISRNTTVIERNSDILEHIRDKFELHRERDKQLTKEIRRSGD